MLRSTSHSHGRLQEAVSAAASGLWWCYQPWPAARPWFGGDAAIGGGWCYHPCVAMLQLVYDGAARSGVEVLLAGVGMLSAVLLAGVEMLPAMLPTAAIVWQRCYHRCVAVLPWHGDAVTMVARRCYQPGRRCCRRRCKCCKGGLAVPPIGVHVLPAVLPTGVHGFAAC
jgi:hypothetical protein